MFKGCLSGNQLKLIAIITMTLDHIGVQLFSEYEILRIIGRLAFPIFAYMIAEGCKYTRNKKKYLLGMMTLALACQVVYFVEMRSLYQCVLVTFSLSILLIYAVDNAKKKKDPASMVLAVAVFAGVYTCTEILPRILIGTDFEIDYGLWGVLMPVLVFMAGKKQLKLIAAAAAMIMISLAYGDIQWYSLAAIVLLALYSGERGKARIKNLFYIYYPLHLVVIYLVSVIYR